MSIKIYNTIGMGFIVGEKIDKDEEKIYLKYPGLLLLDQQTRQGLQHLMFEAIPNVFAGKDDFLKKFPVFKTHIIYSGKPTSAIADLYSQYCANLQTRLSGITVVPDGALKGLPTIGKGGRIQ